jgi:hypothetical protein
VSDSRHFPEQPAAFFQYEPFDSRAARRQQHSFSVRQHTIPHDANASRAASAAGPAASHTISVIAVAHRTKWASQVRIRFVPS